MKLPFGIIQTFLPLADPPRQPSYGKHDSKHVEWNPYGPEHDAAIKIDIGIEVVIYKIGVFYCNFRKLLCNTQEGIVLIDGLQDLIAHPFHDSGSRVVSLIDPVSETHKTKGIIPVLGTGNKGCGITAIVLNLLEHLYHGLVGSPVQRPPKSAYPG